MSDKPFPSINNQSDDGWLAEDLDALENAIDADGSLDDRQKEVQRERARELFEMINRVRHEDGSAQDDDDVSERSRTNRATDETQDLTDHREASDLNESLDQPVEASTGVQIGHYVIIDEIARGGMGVVFRARHCELDREVALKMMISGPFAREEDKLRFRGEAEAAAQLDHSSIVPVFDVGEHCGQPYFTMGYIDGSTLSNEIQAEPMEPTLAADVCKQIAEAVEYAHSKGVVHRDIKPLNILIDQDKRPRITDFGLARRIDSDSDLTGTGQVLGTPNFMAPEQAGGQTDQIGKLSDVYSIGATLYCALTGRPPFQAANAIDTLRLVVDQDPVSPRDLNPSLPVDLATICMKCLQKEPRNRYGSASELAADLQRFLGGEPIHARPVGAMERAFKWGRRHPAITGLMMTVAASMLAIVFGGLWYQFRLSDALSESRARGDENARLLYDSSIKEARFLTQVRPPGYTSRVWETLRQVRHLDTPAKDLDELRQLSISALGDYGADAPDVFPDLGSRMRCADVTWDDRFLIAGMEDGQVLILDRQTDQTLQALPTSDAPIAGVRMLDQNTFMAFTDFCRQLVRYERSETGQWKFAKEIRFENRVEYYPVKPTPDGRFVVGYSLLNEEQVLDKSWDWYHQRPRYVGFSDAANRNFSAQTISQTQSSDVSLEPHRSILNVKGSASVFDVSRTHLVDVQTVREPYGIFVEVANLSTGELESRIATDSGAPGNVIISNDSRYIAYGGHRGAEVIDRESAQRIAKLDYEGICWPVAFVGSQGDLLYNDDAHYILYSSRENRELARYAKDLSRGVLTVSSSGRQLLWLGTDAGRVVDLLGRERAEFDFGLGPAIPCFSPDGRLMIVNSDAGHAVLVDTQTALEIARISGVAATISPDGKFMVTWNDGRLFVWNTSDGSLAMETVCGLRPNEVRFQSSGKWFALVSHNQGHEVWKFDVSVMPGDQHSSPQINTEKVWSESKSMHLGLAWSPQSAKLAFKKAGNSGMVIQIKDFEASENDCELTAGDPTSAGTIAFLNDNQLVVLNQGTLQKWDLTSKTFESSEPNFTYPISASPDGRFVMARNRILGASDLTMLAELPSPGNRVWNLSWSPDNRRVAWAHSDGKTVLWDLESVDRRLRDLDLEFPVRDFESFPTLQPIEKLIALCQSLPGRDIATQWNERFEQAKSISLSQDELPSTIGDRVMWLIDHLPPDTSTPFHRDGQRRRDATHQLNVMITELSKRAASAHCATWLSTLVQVNQESDAPATISVLAESLHTLADLYQYRSEGKLDQAIESYRKSVGLIDTLQQSGNGHLVPDYQQYWALRNFSDAMRAKGNQDAAIEYLKHATDVIIGSRTATSKKNQVVNFERLIDWLANADRFDEARQTLAQGQTLGLKLQTPLALVASSEIEVARWLLGRGGRVLVRKADGTTKQCNHEAELPDKIDGILRVEFFHLEPSEMPPARDLVIMRNLKSLQNLHLGRNPSSASDLAALMETVATLESLTHLYLSATDIEVSGLNVFKGSSLQELTIVGTKAAADRRLDSLRKTLAPTHIIATEAEAATFSLWRKNRQSIALIETSSGDRKLVRGINELPHDGFQLIEVQPDPTQPMDPYAFGHWLPKTRTLENFDLSGRTDISDESIAILSRYHHLKSLDLSETAITPDGISKLRIAIPNCEIVDSSSR